ncbi:PDR/VanB family oxidoreductase [Robbsia sp. Bb-Pol-6]|uniref:PDR/VanB family oxidoreductase n=1 Tax=Robbsia betulipollinis TaxID=2981849 RepID=A0ABT3ZHB4_9BURK|nr:PDR/VanB family oxidoreductase [Robbsia betulipollinis]MCY0385919.1 PDR/VanB family oxidoreductase [Robbsia betulipollinis]
MTATLSLLVREVRYLAERIVGLTLVDPRNAVLHDVAEANDPARTPAGATAATREDAPGILPAWTPGAHIDLLLPSGAVRSYSLCGDPADRTRYDIAVLRDVDGRGGSNEIHDTQWVGRQVAVIGPRNTFVCEPAPHVVFIAGGIGITPLWPMLRAVAAAGASWEMHYLGRSRAAMAFLGGIERTAANARRTDNGAGAPSRATVHIVARDEGGHFDADATLAAAPSGSAVYCCGPERLMQAVERACAGRHALHLERFGRPALPAALAPVLAQNEARADGAGGTSPGSADDAPCDPDSAFQVVLQRSGVTLQVGPDASILEVVRQVRRDLTFSCSSGYCGTCETRVLGGRPDHRDDVLSDAEKAANRSMMICVGRSCSATLVLDL